MQNKKTNYKLLAPTATTMLMAIGCFIHSMEYSPYPTAYYAITIGVGLLAFCFGGLADSENNN